MNNSKSPILQDEILVSKIYFIRGAKVMLDRDLAELYGVETKVLNQAVKRQLSRFPNDFMFQMTSEEFKIWRSQFVTSKADKMGLRYSPYCFTEQGVTMLSSVLNSKRAIEVNIRVVRIFIRLREILVSNKEIIMKLEQLEAKVGSNSEDIENIFKVLRQLINPQTEPRKKVGYKRENEGE